jgi:nucleotidyltransferase substrate binding protein (TIGR01987 family)
MSAPADFSSRDLYGFECCVRDFDILLERWKRDPFDLAVRYSVIKAFELTYQMAVKTLTKYLEANSRRGDEIANFDFQDVIRLADQEGLLKDGWPRWRSYRENRNRAAHMYREEIATAVIASLPNFADEAHVLLENLSLRVKRNG